MTTNRPIRMALIGVRHMGTEHYANLLELVRSGRLELVALCDSEPSALAMPAVRHSLEEVGHMMTDPALDKPGRLALLHEVAQQVCAAPPRTYAKYDGLLEKEALDAVVLATPNFLHRPMVEAALKRDLHVLCEKPLAPTVADCDAMIAAQRHSRGTIQVGLHMRYRKLNHQVKRLIDTGRLGPLKMAWCQEFRGDWKTGASQTEDENGKLTNWRYLEAPSGGSLVEKLCHDFDLFSWWIGAPAVRVSAMGGKGVFTDRQTIDHADILVEYANEVKLNVSLCLFSTNHRFKGRYMGLIGQQATLDLDTGESGCTLYEHTGTTVHFDDVEPPTPPGYHGGKASFAQLEAFVDCLETGRQPFASAEIGRDAVAVAAAAQDAIRQGRVIELAPAASAVAASTSQA